MLPLAKKHGVHILPADSEHSAIFQCIQGLPEGGMRRIILTASGGAFRAPLFRGDRMAGPATHHRRIESHPDTPAEALTLTSLSAAGRGNRRKWLKQGAPKGANSLKQANFWSCP